MEYGKKYQMYVVVDKEGLSFQLKSVEEYIKNHQDLTTFSYWMGEVDFDYVKKDLLNRIKLALETDANEIEFTFENPADVYVFEESNKEYMATYELTEDDREWIMDINEAGRTMDFMIDPYYEECWVEESEEEL